MGVNKKTVVVGAVLVASAAVIATVCVWWLQFEQPHRQALSSFNTAVDTVNAKNTTLDNAVKTLDSVVSGPDQPLDTRTKNDATTLIEKAKASRRKIPDTPGKTKDLNVATERLNEPLNYSKVIAQLSTQQTKLENSIKQLKQVTHPSGDFVIKRLNGLSTLVSIAAATEQNDPNHQLNKAGGYTAAIYFESSLVNKSELLHTDLLENGTDAGGQVEVYKTVDDAQKRDEYLATYDGGVLASGSHTVVGTCLVRASSQMTASQQREITSSVIGALTQLRR